MGKLTSTDLESLEKAGIINKTTAEGIKEKGLASERKRSTKRYMKTKDGKWVSPTLYFRGGTSVEPSEKMTEFRNKFNELLKEYTTVRESK
jgi:hypothetical protein